MTLKSNQGFILGYKFGFVGKLNAAEVRICTDNSGYFIYGVGFSEFISERKLKRYSFIESISIGRKLYNVGGKWIGGDNE